tara:strand:- start:49 stop:1260 length:1212 start_codon:yes stop_codon:yes gene_type:complete
MEKSTLNRKEPQVMKSLGNKLYIKNGKYNGRIKLRDGGWTYRALKNRDGSEIHSEREARDRLILLQAEINTGELTSESPRESRTDSGQRVDSMIQDYASEGYPDSEHNQRGGDLDIIRAFKHLRSFFGGRDPEDLCKGDCHSYHVYRCSVAKNGSGKRATDLDLTHLSTMFNWAVDYKRMKTNPIAKRGRYQKRKLVKNCTQSMPMTDEEFHDLIAQVFINSRWNVMTGWQGLLEGLTGCRTGEVLKLLANPEPMQPGWFNDEYLYVDRLKDGIFPYVIMHDPLRQVLTAARAYKEKHHPHSKYLLVGKGGISPMRKDTLTHALQRAAKQLGLGPRTSHGLRAYYVRVCRSQGIPDQEIGMRLGHRSGVSLIKDTYGLNEPGLYGEKKLDFMPKDSPAAWERN